MPIVGARAPDPKEAPPGPARLRHLLPLLAVTLFGFFLRLEPALRAGEVEFDGEAAFHERMLRTVADTGHLPEVDPLGLPPEGKPVRALVPPLAYDVSVFGHRFVAAIHPIDIDQSAIILTALLGALIAVPVFAAARALGLGPLAAAIAAAFAVLSPAHVRATLGHRLGDEALGTLLTTAHLATVVAALAAARGPRLIAASAIAAATLAAAMATSRPALALVPLESLVVLGAFLVRRLRPPLLVAFAPSLAAALAASLVVPHLITGPFLLSRSGALAFLTLGLLLLDAATALHAQRGRRAWIPRAGLVAVILATSVGLGRAPSFDNRLEELEARLGIERAGRALRVLAVAPRAMGDEAAGNSDAGDLAIVAIIALVYAAGRCLSRGKPVLISPLTRRSTAALPVWHGAATTFFLLTLAARGFAGFAAPVLAVYPGLLLDSLRAAPAASGSAPASRSLSAAASLVLATVLAALLAWTAAGDWHRVHRLSARLEPELRAALSWLGAEARPGDVVLCDWTRGDVIQAMTGLPTATDGMIALPEMRRRIAAHAAALYAENPDSLLSIRRRDEGRFLWINKERQAANAEVAGISHADYFVGDRPTARGSRTVVGRLLARPDELPGLVQRFAAGPDIIFEFVP